MFDTIIKNGKIIDGSGNPCISADIGIVDDKITAIGQIQENQGLGVIDARGKFVCPGL